MSGPGQALQVFISYARSDCSAFAEDLLAGLEAAGFKLGRAFLLRHGQNGGENSSRAALQIAPGASNMKRPDHHARRVRREVQVKMRNIDVHTYGALP